MKQSQPIRTKRPVAAIMFKLPFMIDCVEFETFIIDYLEGTLPKRQRVLFDLHLALCRECREYLRSYKSTMEQVKSQTDITFSEMGMGGVPEDLITAVLEARDRG